MCEKYLSFWVLSFPSCRELPEAGTQRERTGRGMGKMTLNLRQGCSHKLEREVGSEK